MMTDTHMCVCVCVCVYIYIYICMFVCSIAMMDLAMKNRSTSPYICLIHNCIQHAQRIHTSSYLCHTHNRIWTCTQHAYLSQDVVAMMDVAMKNRSTSSTSMNEHSSRSHLILTVQAPFQSFLLPCSCIVQIFKRKENRYSTLDVLHVILVLTQEHVSKVLSCACIVHPVLCLHCADMHA